MFNEQSCLKTTGLSDGLLCLSFFFTLSILYSVLPFHLVYISLFFLIVVLSQDFIKSSSKAFV